MGAQGPGGYGVLVIRAITEPDGARPMVVEVVEMDLAGHDHVLLVTSSQRQATRAVRDWLGAQDSVVPRRTTSRERTGRRAHGAASTRSS